MEVSRVTIMCQFIKAYMYIYTVHIDAVTLDSATVLIWPLHHFNYLIYPGATSPR